MIKLDMNTTQYNSSAEYAAHSFAERITDLSDLSSHNLHIFIKEFYGKKIAEYVKNIEEKFQKVLALYLEKLFYLHYNILQRYGEKITESVTVEDKKSFQKYIATIFHSHVTSFLKSLDLHHFLQEGYGEYGEPISRKLIEKKFVSLQKCIKSYFEKKYNWQFEESDINCAELEQSIKNLFDLYHNMYKIYIKLNLEKVWNFSKFMENSLEKLFNLYSRIYRNYSQEIAQNYIKQNKESFQKDIGPYLKELYRIYYHSFKCNSQDEAEIKYLKAMLIHTALRRIKYIYTYKTKHKDCEEFQKLNTKIQSEAKEILKEIFDRHYQASSEKYNRTKEIIALIINCQEFMDLLESQETKYAVDLLDERKKKLEALHAETDKLQEEIKLLASGIKNCVNKFSTDPHHMASEQEPISSKLSTEIIQLTHASNLNLLQSRSKSI